jgi:hypothetical protein
VKEKYEPRKGIGTQDKNTSITYMKSEVVHYAMTREGYMKETN